MMITKNPSEPRPRYSVKSTSILASALSKTIGTQSNTFDSFGFDNNNIIISI